MNLALYGKHRGMIFNFSYRQEIYDEKTEHGRRYLKWTNKDKTWSYPECTVTVLSIKNKAHIVLRRARQGKSRFKNSQYILKLMMGFSVATVKKTHHDSVYELIFTIPKTNDINLRNLRDVKMWSDDKDAIDTLFDNIQDKMQNHIETGNTIAPNYDENNKVIPIIYQPRIDAWENFLREINIHKEGNSFKVTLAFQGEKLRKFFLVDPIYKLYRFFRFKRTVDIETFEIREDQFYFENIYSDTDTLFDDHTHNKKDISIKYYFSNLNHPVIFVNTANHALAPHDNNHDFWKWEYIPWEENTPLELGEKTRNETEKQYKRF